MDGVFAVPAGKSPSASHRFFNRLHRVNIPDAEMDRRITAARSYGFPEVAEPLPPKNKPVAIVCGGPTLETTHHLLTHWPGDITACKRAGSWLYDRGITPTALVDMDQDTVPERLDERLKEIPHYLAHQMRPDYFEAAKDHNVILWHPWHGGDGQHDRDWWAIGNGPTVGCRSVFLMLHLGYRNIHLFGMDGNFTHVQHIYDGPDETPYERSDQIRVIVNGRVFLSQPAMARQAIVLRDLTQRTSKFVRYQIYGDSLLSAIVGPEKEPDIKVALRPEQAASGGMRRTPPETLAGD